MPESRTGYLNEKQAHLNRLKRIEETVALSLLHEHLRHCVTDAVRVGGEEAKTKITEASEAIARLVRS